MPKPPCGAVVSTKKTIIVPCIVTSDRYNSGEITPPGAPSPKSLPRSGHACSGQVIFILIMTDMSMPRTTEKSASRRYWMPMTLWSMLKMYLRMKFVGGPW